jgi:polyisoprenoid-binding protein YceI
LSHKSKTKKKFKIKTMKKILILLAAAFSYTAASAQTTWTVDKAHSNVKFTVTHLMVSDVDGIFKSYDATITAAKPDFSDAKFQISIQTASVTTDNDQRDKHISSPDFFDVATYPTITFTSTAITKTSDKHYKLTGNLTLHGVTKPASFDLWYRGTIQNPMSKADDAGFQLTGTISRADFNFGSKFPGAMVSDEVTIKANGEFGKAK